VASKSIASKLLAGKPLTTHDKVLAVTLLQWPDGTIRE
jgi:hypothetical protein